MPAITSISRNEIPLKTVRLRGANCVNRARNNNEHQNRRPENDMQSLAARCRLPDMRQRMTQISLVDDLRPGRKKSPNHNPLAIAPIATSAASSQNLAAGRAEHGKFIARFIQRLQQRNRSGTLTLVNRPVYTTA